MIPDVMKKKVLDKERRFVYLKAFDCLTDTESAIRIVVNSTLNIQLSVLSKIHDELGDEDKTIQELTSQYWENSLGTHTGFGILTSPDIGNYFIAGTLADLFLQEIDGKPIGEMNTGVYGILRGLGFHQNTVDIFLKDLLAGQYLLISRGMNAQIDDIQNLLG